MDLLEQKIKNILSNKITEPDNYEYIIKNTINKQYNTRIKFNNITKYCVTICACLFIITTVVFAEEIEILIKQWLDVSDGVNQATNNGYIEEIQKEYIEAEDASITVSSITMDDLNLNLKFKGKFNKNIDYNKLARLKFMNIRIKDENNNVFFARNEEKQVNKDEFSNKEDDDYNRLYTSRYASYVIDINEKEIEFEIGISGKDLPKSKELTIEIEDISLSSINYDKEVMLKGKWDIKIDVPSKFYNRESVVYKVIECNNEKVNIDAITATVHNTGMKFYMEMELYDGIKENMNKYDGTGKIEDYLSIKNNAYVENEKGQKFYRAAKSDGDGGYGVENNTFKYWQTFNITTYDITNDIKIVLETAEKQVIVIKLKRE